MKYLTKENGQLSVSNLVNLAVLLTSLLEVWRPFIPAEYIPYIVAGIATLNLILRTFQTDGVAIQK